MICELKVGDLVLSSIRGLGMITGQYEYGMYDITWFDNRRLSTVDYSTSTTLDFRHQLLEMRRRLGI